MATRRWAKSLVVHFFSLHVCVHVHTYMSVWVHVLFLTLFLPWCPSLFLFHGMFLQKEEVEEFRVSCSVPLHACLVYVIIGVEVKNYNYCNKVDFFCVLFLFWVLTVILLLDKYVYLEIFYFAALWIASIAETEKCPWTTCQKMTWSAQSSGNFHAVVWLQTFEFEWWLMEFAGVWQGNTLKN